MRATRDGSDGIYLMAAAIADPSACDEVRDDLRAATEKKAERLHWRHETPERQAKIAATIGNQEIVNLVVVGTPLDARRQERARRICTERLSYELDSLGVTHVWLEARVPASLPTLHAGGGKYRATSPSSSRAIGRLCAR